MGDKLDMAAIQAAKQAGAIMPQTTPGQNSPLPGVNTAAPLSGIGKATSVASDFVKLLKVIDDGAGVLLGKKGATAPKEASPDENREAVDSGQSLATNPIETNPEPTEAAHEDGQETALPNESGSQAPGGDLSEVVALIDLFMAVFGDQPISEFRQTLTQGMDIIQGVQQNG